MLIPLLRRIRADFLHFLAPRLCPSCDGALGDDEHSYCPACRISIDAAPFPFEIYAELTQRFARGSLALSAVGARYAFERGSCTQKLIYALKYQGCYRLGVELGDVTGRSMRMFTEFDDVDLIVPVPLHRAKRRQRGYNQSEAIAEGIARAFGLKTDTAIISRIRHTESQTTLSARQRQQNVVGAFRVADTHRLEGRSVLLCDDVFTTGATLNTCATAMIAAGARRVLAVTVAKDVI